MSRPLPSSFAVSCTASGCWLAVTPSNTRSSGRTLERTKLQMIDFVADDEAPIAPVLPPVRRLIQMR